MRFRNHQLSNRYFGYLENIYARPASAGECLGKSTWWNYGTGPPLGPLANLRKHDTFLILWGYYSNGRYLAILKGSIGEANALCNFWVGLSISQH